MDQTYQTDADQDQAPAPRAAAWNGFPTPDVVAQAHAVAMQAGLTDPGAINTAVAHLLDQHGYDVTGGQDISQWPNKSAPPIAPALSAYVNHLTSLKQFELPPNSFNPNLTTNLMQGQPASPTPPTDPNGPANPSARAYSDFLGQSIQGQQRAQATQAEFDNQRLRAEQARRMAFPGDPTYHEAVGSIMPMAENQDTQERLNYDPMMQAYAPKPGVAGNVEQFGGRVQASFERNVAGLAGFTGGMLQGGALESPGLEQAAQYGRQLSNRDYEQNPLNLPYGAGAVARFAAEQPMMGAKLLTGPAAPYVFAATGAGEGWVRAKNATDGMVARGEMSPDQASKAALLEGTIDGGVSFLSFGLMGKIAGNPNAAGSAAWNMTRNYLGMSAMGLTQAAGSDLGAYIGHGEKPSKEQIIDQVEGSLVQGFTGPVLHMAMGGNFKPVSEGGNVPDEVWPQASAIKNLRDYRAATGQPEGNLTEALTAEQKAGILKFFKKTAQDLQTPEPTPEKEAPREIPLAPKRSTPQTGSIPLAPAAQSDMPESFDPVAPGVHPLDVAGAPQATRPGIPLVDEEQARPQPEALGPRGKAPLAEPQEPAYEGPPPQRGGIPLARLQAPERIPLAQPPEEPGNRIPLADLNQPPQAPGVPLRPRGAAQDASEARTPTFAPPPQEIAPGSKPQGGKTIPASDIPNVFGVEMDPTAARAVPSGTPSPEEIGKSTQAPITKSTYTNIPKEWIGQNLDMKGAVLFSEKGASVAARPGQRGKLMPQDYQANTTFIPAKGNDALIDAIRQRTDEVWPVTGRPGGKAFLVPKNLAENLRAEHPQTVEPARQQPSPEAMAAREENRRQQRAGIMDELRQHFMHTGQAMETGRKESTDKSILENYEKFPPDAGTREHLLLHLYKESLADPKGQKYQWVDPAQMKDGDRIKIGKETMTLDREGSEDPQGRPMLRDGITVPVDEHRPIPAKQLLGPVHEEEGYVMPDHGPEPWDAPARPQFFNADTAGLSAEKKGLFGQAVFDPATGQQQGMAFETQTPASEAERLRQHSTDTETREMFANAPAKPTPISQHMDEIRAGNFSDAKREAAIAEYRDYTGAQVNKLMADAGYSPGKSKSENLRVLDNSLRIQQNMADSAAAIRGGSGPPIYERTPDERNPSSSRSIQQQPGINPERPAGLRGGPAPKAPGQGVRPEDVRGAAPEREVPGGPSAPASEQRKFAAAERPEENSGGGQSIRTAEVSARFPGGHVIEHGAGRWEVQHPNGQTTSVFVRKFEASEFASPQDVRGRIDSYLATYPGRELLDAEGKAFKVPPSYEMLTPPQREAIAERARGAAYSETRGDGSAIHIDAAMDAETQRHLLEHERYHDALNQGISAQDMAAIRREYGRPGDTDSGRAEENAIADLASLRDPAFDSPGQAIMRRIRDHEAYGPETKAGSLGRDAAFMTQDEGGSNGFRPLHPMERKALDFFGETKDPHEAGYILSNGKMLDFSGTQAKEPIRGAWDSPASGERTFAHESIRQATGENGEGQGDEPAIGAVRAFLNHGAARIDTSYRNLNIEHALPLTDAQKQVISRSLEGRQWTIDRAAPGSDEYSSAQGTTRAALGEHLAAEKKFSVQDIMDDVRRFAGKGLPATHRLSQESGNAMAEWAASNVYRKAETNAAIAELLPQSRNAVGRMGADPEMASKIGQWLQQDKQNALRNEYTRAGDPAKAAAVNDTYGMLNSSFKDRAAFDAFTPYMKNFAPDYKTWFNATADLNYRDSHGTINYNHGLGEISGARINSIALDKNGEPYDEQTVPGTKAGNLYNPILKRSPHDRPLEGNAPNYEFDMRKLIENSMTGEPVAAQHRAYKQLEADGLGKFFGPTDPTPTFGGKPGVQFLVKRFGQNDMFAVDPRIAGEFKSVLNTDSPHYSEILRTAGAAANQMAMLGTGEAVYHLQNLGAALTRNDLQGIPRASAKAIQLYNNDPATVRHFADLARIGATRDPAEYQDASQEGKLGKTDPAYWKNIINGKGEFDPRNAANYGLHLFDAGSRLALDDVYQKWVKKGSVVDTDQNRRDFINGQLGQYNKVMQPRVLKFLRDSGLNPIATAVAAGVTRNARMTFGLMAPGVQTTTLRSEGMLRMAAATRVAGIAAAVAGIAAMRSDDKRPNQPIGVIPLKDAANGQVRDLDLTDALTGIRGAAKETFVNAVVEGLNHHMTAAEIFDQGTKEALGRPAGMAGPLGEFLMKAAYGHDAAGYQTAMKANPGESQTLENLKSAAVGSNAQLENIAGRGQSSILGRVGVKSGKMDRTEAEEMAHRIFREQEGEGGGMSTDELNAWANKLDAVQKMREGNPGQIARQLIDSKQYDSRQVNEMIRESRQSPLVAALGRVKDVDRALQVWDVASEQEKQQVRPELARKIRNDAKLTPDQKRAYLSELTAQPAPAS